MITDEQLQKEIAAIWKLRHARQVKEAQKRFSVLNSAPLNMQPHLLVLESSFFRAAGDLSRAKLKLKEAAQLHLQTQTESDFQFDFQSGLNLFVEGRFASAMEFFMRARKKTEFPYEEALTLGNLLLCFENLGMPLGKTLVDLKSRVKTLSEPEQKEIFTSQIEAFEQRQFFRQGDLQKVFEPTNPLINSQSYYYQNWVASLPQLNLKKKRAESVLDFDSDLFQFSYRMGTLYPHAQGKVPTPKVSDKFDRLYLWTWKYLTGDTQVSMTTLEKHLVSFTPEEILLQSTIEDLQLFTLSLRWLGLVSDESITVSTWLKKNLPVTVEFFPVFAEENKTLESLEKLKGVKLQSKLSAQSFLNFSRPQDSPLDLLLKRKVAGSRLQLGKALYVLDLSTFEVYKSGKRVLISEPLCHLMKSLKEKKSLSFSGAMKDCYQIPRFDESHIPKIHNLLNRAKKLFEGTVLFLTRRERIYIEGDLSQIHFIQDSHPAPKLNLPDWMEAQILKKESLDRWVKFPAILKKIDESRQLTRPDLERWISSSKATANRLIKLWLEEGLLIKSGVGKSTFYQVDLRGSDF